MLNGVLVWNLANGQTKMKLPIDDIKSVVQGPQGIWTSHGMGTKYDPKTVGRIRLWDTETSEIKQIFETEASYVGNLACSTDGSQICGTVAGDLRVWDTKTGERLPMVHKSTEAKNCMRFSCKQAAWNGDRLHCKW